MCADGGSGWRRTAGDASASTRARRRRLPHVAAGNIRSAGEALAVDVRRERFWADAAEPTHVNGLDLAFGEQLVQKASSDPGPLRHGGRATDCVRGAAEQHDRLRRRREPDDIAQVLSSTAPPPGPTRGGTTARSGHSQRTAQERYLCAFSSRHVHTPPREGQLPPVVAVVLGGVVVDIPECHVLPEVGVPPDGKVHPLSSAALDSLRTDDCRLLRTRSMSRSMRAYPRKRAPNREPT